MLCTRLLWCSLTGAALYTSAVVHASTVVYTGAVLHTAAVVYTGAMVYTRAVVRGGTVPPSWHPLHFPPFFLICVACPLKMKDIMR